MVRKQLVLNAFATLAGMLGYSTILLAAPLATVVDSSNASCISPGSEVDSLTVNDAGVELVINGSCSGSVGTTPSGVEVDKLMNAIDEGAVGMIIPLAQDVTVKLPFTLSFTQPQYGTATRYGEYSVDYEPPVPGTVPATGGEDSFNYTVADATGTATGTVTIPINSVDSVVITPTGDVCVESTTVDCKGELSEWPAGSLVRVSIGDGITHVYHFDYYKDVNNTGNFILFDGDFKVVSVSLNPNDFSLSFPCQITQVVPEHALQYAPDGAAGFGECPLEDGKRYFLNIKSTASNADVYSLTVR